ncbi:MAG: TonB-dependent receptor [Flavobacterium sp. MedPE-SWcel]|uniref:TonB-dependent receptor n=1 Tax=uncultured Flavobacterium sp. TaxID=165435 RepID=UPI0009249BD7|nr:TonB-dependent receptor [uncultured Flavobacterium sp.]OIQ21699.1 MAG: TonB-dependent receptor [Flavobacterium sp. MedPE-SWcel]
MKLRFLLISLFIFTLGFSQNTGTITGTVTDKDMNNETLPFASVAIKGTTIGANTDMDGKYSLKVPAGNHTLVFGFLGYETIEVTVAVAAGETKVINKAMTSTSVQLEDVVIEKVISREKESALLLEQKKAVEIKQNIGAQEMARKGASDAAAAVSKTSGISKQEGSGSVYVRGLGDRYNITTMNGLPLPSDNPARKNISLEIFSADVVGYIGIDKTYSLKNYGDFGGANVDIVSKDYKGNGFFEISVGSGFNSNATNEDNFYLQDGPSYTGFSNQEQPNNPLEGYNFDTKWNKQTVTPINTSISVKGGDSYDVGEEGRMSFFATGSFDNKYSYKEGIARGSVSAQGVARKDFNSQLYSYTTNTTLMGNLNYKINLNNKIKFNSLFINSSSQNHDEYYGVIDIFDNAPNGGGVVRRSTFDRTSLYVNQLLGTNKFSEKFDIDWGLSYNFVNNVIPDRMQNTLRPVDDNGDLSITQLNDLSNSDNNRYFQDLKENEVAANIFTNYNFSKDSEELYRGKLTVGYSGRIKSVDFEATQYNFKLAPDNITQPIVTLDNLDDYFTQANYDANLYSIVTFRGGKNFAGALRPQTYNGDQSIHAGLVSGEYRVSPKFTVIAGGRVEVIQQDIDWDTSISQNSSSLSTTQFLPSLSLKYEINDKQNLKFAASKTYTLPQFKERAPFLYEEVVQTYIGNEDLYESDNYNIDLKWEFFPEKTELISFTAFGKYIQNPINEVIIASATNDVSWINTGEKATVIGGEFEIRKNIFSFKHGEDSMLKNTLSFGANATYMYHNQDFDREKVGRETRYNVDFTSDEGELTGASDLLINGDISYNYQFSQDRNIMATVAYNYFSDRLYAIGTNNRGDLVDKAVGTLDFIFKTQLSKKLSIGLSVKNILDPEIRRIQEVDPSASSIGADEIDVISYKKGLFSKISLTYKF